MKHNVQWTRQAEISADTEDTFDSEGSGDKKGSEDRKGSAAEGRMDKHVKVSLVDVEDSTL